MVRFEILDHTADIGIIIRGKNLKELFSNAAYAMFSLITDLERVDLIEAETIEVTGANLEELMVNWLSELLYCYEVKDLLLKEFEILKIEDGSLKARVYGEKLDANKHYIKTEIKTVTYHQLEVKRQNDFWKTQVIFDV